jgi:hypothetical protein
MADVAPEPAAGLDQDLSGPLVEPDQGWIVDEEPTLVASEAIGDAGPLAPEESAIHVVSEDEAPDLNWDESPGYVDEDPAERPAGSGTDTTDRG